MTTQRRIFIGDIQGCRVELEQLLEKLRFDPSSDVLHPVGDMVNRGPDSVGVLRLLKSLDAGGVLGNHEVHLLRTAAGMRRPAPSEHMECVLDAPDRQELLEWLAARPWCLEWDDLICIHAGVHPAWEHPAQLLAGIPPTEPTDDADFAVLVRHCDSSGQRAPKDEPDPGAPFVPWWQLWEARTNEIRKVVFGHWARQGLLMRDKVVGLDSGCVYGGELSAWIPEEGRLVQVPAQKAWSPVTPPRKRS